MIEFYNEINYRKIYEIYRIFEFEKISTLMAKNLFKLNAYQIIKILLVLYNTYKVLKNQDKLIFYINNYIN